MREPAVARTQAGAFTRRQARDAGFALSTIRRRLARGDWIALLGPACIERSTRPSERTWAWAAHLVTGGVISHDTAAVLHGLAPGDRGHDPSPLHVISRERLHVRAPGVVEHRVRLHPDEIVRSAGLPITTHERTLVDRLALLPVGDARVLLFRAVQQGWISRESLASNIARRARMAGNKQLRELSDLLGTGAHSVAELALHRILTEISGVRFEANVPVVVDQARYVVDVLLREPRIVIEVDGRRFHSDADQFARDRRRQNALIGAGYLVLRFTWLDLIDQPDRVGRDVRRAISVPR